MNATPLVSIVIANYNYGRFLAEAIESALGQTHWPIEVIVVDDGSTDDSVAVAGGYPVRVVAQPNQGVSAARNAGAALASGSYLMFLDADDVLEPTYVERCREALEAAPAEVAYAYTAMRIFGLEERIYPSRAFSPRALVRGTFINASALIRTQVFRAAGGFDPTWTLGHEDYELWVRLLHRGWHGVWLPEPLLRYRSHGPSRNALDKNKMNALKWRIRVSYPGLFWTRLIRHPFQWLWWHLKARKLQGPFTR